MEAFLIAVLFVAVIVLAIKLSRLSEAKSAIVELLDLTRRLDQRLTNAEHQIAHLVRSSIAPQIGSEIASVPISSPEDPISSKESLVESASEQRATSTRANATPPPPPPLISASLPGPIPTTRFISLEERLGQNWLSKIGIVLVVLGIATFLGYKLVTLGPLGKSLTGLISSLTLLVGGLILERRPTYRIFARAGIGGGWALLFFTTFALYHVAAMQVLTSQAADLILMSVVAAAMVWHSLRYKLQVVTALAFLLAFATVGISDITFFSLIAGAILAAALVSIAAREFWFELGLAGLCGVYFNHFLWLQRVLPNGGQLSHLFPDFLPSVGLLLLYWLLFRLYYVLRVPQNNRQQLIAAITAVLNSAGLIALLKYQSPNPEWTFNVLLGLGMIELLLAFLARPRNRSAFLVLATIASAPVARRNPVSLRRLELDAPLAHRVRGPLHRRHPDP